MDVKLYRFSSRADDTLGLLLVDDVFACFTLEDEHRDVKVRGETRIPAGRYRLSLQESGRLHRKYAERFPDLHRGMILVEDVPNFSGVMIHCGNRDEDTDGCPLVGDTVQQNVTESGFLGGSTSAYRRVYPVIRDAIERGERVYLEVENGS